MIRIFAAASSESAHVETKFGFPVLLLAIVVVAIATALGVQSLLTAIDNLAFIQLALNTRLLLAAACGLVVIAWSSRLYIVQNRGKSNAA